MCLSGDWDWDWIGIEIGMGIKIGIKIYECTCMHWGIISVYHGMDIRVGFLEFLMGLFRIYEGEKKCNGISCIYFRVLKYYLSWKPYMGLRN